MDEHRGAVRHLLLAGMARCPVCELDAHCEAGELADLQSAALYHDLLQHLTTEWGHGAGLAKAKESRRTQREARSDPGSDRGNTVADTKYGGNK